MSTSIASAVAKRWQEMDWTRVNQFILKIKETHKVGRNPIMNQQWFIGEKNDDMDDWYGFVEICDEGKPNQLGLKLIVALDKGKGNGSKMLDVICAAADKLQIDLALEAKVVGYDNKRLRQANLEKWYRSRGWQRSNTGNYLKMYLRKAG